MSTLPATPPRSWVEQWRLLEQKRKIETPKRDVFSTLSTVLARPDFGTLGSETGQPFFSGADTSFGFSNLYPYSAALQRQSDCSLNELVGGLAMDNPSTPDLLQNIAHYEQYLHKVAGLTTTVDKFPNGCKDPTSTGVLGMGAYTGKDTSGDYTGGGFNFSDQTRLDIRVLSTSISQVSVTHVTVFNGGDINGVMSVDVNGDGYPDFVVIGTGTTYSDSMIAVLLNNHDGTFGAPKLMTLSNTYINGLVAADFNGDGHVDLLATTASTSGSSTTYNLVFYPGKGDGTFGSAVTTSTGTTEKLVETPADLNNDSKIDVVAFDIATGKTGVTLDALINNGSGAFTSKTSFTLPFQGAAAVGDLNGDGKVDLAILDPEYNAMTLAKGDGTGAFTAQTTYPTPYSPSGVAIADLDGDGYNDVAIAYAGGGVYAPGGGTSYGIFGVALLGNNNFTLSTPAALAPGTAAKAVQSSQSVAVADFNGDGKQDVATLAASASDSLLLQTYLNSSGTLTYSKSVTLPLAPGLYQGNTVVAADLNGDGKADVVVSGTDQTTGNYEIVGLTNDGTGTLTLKTPLVVPAAITLMTTGDFNGDGHQDVAFIADALYVATGKGDGTFNAPTVVDANVTEGSAIAAADLNGDGKLDLIAAQSPKGYAGASSVQVYLNKGSGTFAAPISFEDENGDYVTSIAVADFNKDGSPDLAVLGFNSEATLYIYTGNKTGKFTFLSAADAGSDGAQNIVVADINQDGNLDVVQDGCCGNATPSVMLAQGPGKFYPEQPFANVESALGVHVIALNSDAYPDVIFGTSAGYVPVLNNYAAAVSSSKEATTVTIGDLYPTQQGTDAYPTATVTSSGSGIPTGDITYTFNGQTYTQPIGSGTVYLTLPTTLKMEGNYPVSVTYLGDEYNAGSTATASQPIIYATATTISASPTTVTSGNTLTLTAKVTRPNGTGNPTGDVGFWYNGGNSLLGNATLVNGVATLSEPTASVPTGIYDLFAQYGSDTNDGFSDSSTIAVTVVPKGDTGTTTTLSLNPTSAPVGGYVNGSIHVALSGSSTKPSGSASIYLDGANIATLPLSNGATSFTEQVPSSLTYGAHTVYAQYNTDGKDFESASVPQTFTVQYPTETILSINTPSGAPGQAITISVSVYNNYNFYVTPTGTVTIYADGQPLATVPLNSGSATVNTTVPSGYPVGTYEVTAGYNGDTQNAKSVSPPYGFYISQ